MIFYTVPLSIIILFISTSLFTYFWLAIKLHASKIGMFIISIWLILQAILGYQEFYKVNNTFPPRFLLMILPPMLFILFLFNTKKGKAFIDRMDIKKLTLLHIIRIPVEIMLFSLYTVNLVPELMTFEGANFDIVSGISALFIYYFVLNKTNFNKKILIVWNVICLTLLLIVVVIAILSAQTPFQQWSFEQPNIGVLFFPFNWLPSFIVPVVLFSHLAALRKLLFHKLIK